MIDNPQERCQENALSLMMMNSLRESGQGVGMMCSRRGNDLRAEMTRSPETDRRAETMSSLSRERDLGVGMTVSLASVKGLGVGMTLSLRPDRNTLISGQIQTRRIILTMRA